MPFPFSQAAENNKAPIAAILRAAFAHSNHVLEIGSGTGQHAVHLAAILPHLVWQPSDLAENMAGLRARIDAEGTENLLAPIVLDVASRPWPVAQFDAIFCANAVHIMSWAHVEGLFAGIGSVLVNDGLLCLYGPFKHDGAFTTESNARFDDWLKSRDPASGVRDFEGLDALAKAQGLMLEADHQMPANNQLILWRRTEL